MINIIIPSYSRSHGLRGIEYFPMAMYCVPQSQVEEYAKVVGIKRIIACPDSEDGNYCRKRNWILRNIPKPLIMIDDDVAFLQYWDDRGDGYLKEKFPQGLVPSLFEHMVQLAKDWGVHMFGVAQNGDDRSFKEFMPFSLTKIICGPFQGHVDDHGLFYDESMPSKDDYDMSLQQLNKFKKILRFNKFSYDCEHGDNSGGLVSYRTQEKEIEWCKAIMVKWGKDIITYRIPPRNKTDLLNAKKVTVPIKGV